MIRQLKEENILFCAASGRQYQSLQNLFLPVKNDILYLCENGMQVIYKDKILYEETLDCDLAIKICKAILEYEECEIMVSSSHTSYVLNRNKEYIRYLKNDVKNEITIINSLEEIKTCVLKVAAYIPSSCLEKVRSELYALFSCDCQILTSGHIWVDFVPHGIDKGSAILKISEILEIPLEEMMTFGDNENDRTMLEKVKYAYLMKNCNPTMKALNNQYKVCEKVELTLKTILRNRKEGNFNENENVYR